MVDGRIDEYLELDVEPIEISPEVNLFIYQNEHYVWLAYDYTVGSYGTIDLSLEAPNLPEALNLHVSGQMGEWPVSRPDEAPDNPESEKWWNYKGWTANPIWINGMDRSGTEARYRFQNTPAREIQLSKERFGKGEWRFSMEIRSIRTEEGNMVNVVFPVDQESYILSVY